MSGISVGVLDLPSQRSAAWRQGFIQAAATEAVAYTEMRVTNEDFPGWRPPPRSILLTDTVSRGDWIEPQDWIILGSDPGEMLGRIRKAFPEWTHGEAVRHVSDRLATAAFLIDRGARLLDASATMVKIPGLEAIDLRPVESEQSLAEPAAGLKMYDVLPVPTGSGAVWTPDLFRYTRGQQADGGEHRIDMTGRGRIVIHGPYLSLPPGLWRATATFDVDPEGIVAFLRFDWGVGVEVVSEVAEITHPGRYSIVLERPWTTPGAAELRVWVSRPVFKGVFELIDCQVERIG